MKPASKNYRLITIKLLLFDGNTATIWVQEIVVISTIIKK